ncbi:rolling circle replication-associated protein, partial [Pseudalkalibacillus sp. JSM 102089]|uniref:rolling circle replication-associated protein n=1 Tax=Pseudalkalibacillus sp. JSM 102089 TaxID=3229856 RepID=UPI003CD0C593
QADFKYLAVLEFQDRGAVHYHMMCNSPYVPQRDLLQLWRKGGDDGGVDIRDIKQVDNVGAYMVKYMLKNTHDDRLQGNKAYLSSKGLAKSSVVRGTIVKDILKNYGISEDTEKVFESSYSSEHHGCVRYKEYNLKRL